MTRVTMLVLALGLSACEARTPVAARIRVDVAAYQTQRPTPWIAGMPPQENRWLVRVTGIEHRITDLAVSAGHLYFATLWEGVYRIPSTGGSLEVVDWGPDALFSAMVGSPAAAHWVKHNFDDRDYPHAQLRQIAAGANTTQTVFAADWGVVPSNDQPGLAFDGQALYGLAHHAGKDDLALRRVPIGAGNVVELVPVPMPGAQPAWLVDDRGLYFTNCLGKVSAECPVELVDSSGSSRLTAAIVPDTSVVLQVADQNQLYLRTSTRIWAVAKEGGVARMLLELTDGRFLGGGLLVDDQNVYFQSRGAGGATVGALPKAGGAARTLGAPLPGYMVRLCQDQQRLYLLVAQLASDGQQILIIDKP